MFAQNYTACAIRGDVRLAWHLRLPMLMGTHVATRNTYVLNGFSTTFASKRVLAPMLG